MGDVVNYKSSREAASSFIEFFDNLLRTDSPPSTTMKSVRLAAAAGLYGMWCASEEGQRVLAAEREAADKQ